MIIVSNHLLSTTNLKFDSNIVMRVNLAWIPTIQEASELLKNLKGHFIYLDYPQGRTKPPTPTITLDEAIELANKTSNVRYFAVSNVEDPVAISAIYNKLREGIELVPKIETAMGIHNFEVIVESIEADYVMLDKEDLWIDVSRQTGLFNEQVELIRRKADDCGVRLLELQGVVFSS